MGVAAAFGAAWASLVFADGVEGADEGAVEVGVLDAAVPADAAGAGIEAGAEGAGVTGFGAAGLGPWLY